MVKLAPSGVATTRRAGAIVEEIEPGPSGIEQRWRVASAPAGDSLVVRVRVEGYDYDRATAGGLHFRDAASGVRVRYGAATWVDAQGKKTPVPSRWIDHHIELSVPAEVLKSSSYPALLDPIISPEVAIDAPVELAVSYPVVAAGNTHYLVVWHGAAATDGTYPLYATRLRATDGAKEDASPILLASTPTPYIAPSVAFDGAGYLVVWAEEHDEENRILANRVVESTGAIERAEPIVVSGGSFAFNPLVAYGAGTYLVVTQDFGLTATRVRASDLAVEPPVALAMGTSDPFTGFGASGITFASGRFLVAASRSVEDENGDDASLAVLAYRVDPATGQNIDPNGITLAEVPVPGYVSPSVSFEDDHVRYTWMQLLFGADDSVSTQCGVPARDA